MNSKPFEDPIVDAIHAIRTEILAECNGDLDALVKLLVRREQESGREVRAAPPKPISLTGHPLTAGLPVQTPTPEH